MTKTLTLDDVAIALNAKVIGDGSIRVSRLAHPADIHSPEDLALATDAKLVPLLKGTPVRAAVISADAEMEPDLLEACIIVERGRFAMAALTALFAEPVSVAPGVHPTAFVEEGAVLGADVAVGPFAYIGTGAVIGERCVIHPQTYIGPDVRLGADSVLFPGVRLGAGTQVGARAIIHFNASIGADGFSFVTPQTGSVESAKATGAVGATNTKIVRICSLAPVLIGDDVEIGANTSVDRGTIASTRIGSGTKIDNQVQVGHNVQIGENCMICGRVGIAGSAEIGNRVVLGGAVGVADHVKIGDDSIAMAMSGISGNLPPKSLVMGAPAKPRQAVIAQAMNIHRIRGLIDKVEKLAQRMAKIDGADNA